MKDRISKDEEDDDNDAINLVDLQNIEESFLYVPIHSICFVHTLQLVIKDGFKKAKFFSKAKVSKIISFICRSIHGCDILEGE